MVTINDSIKAPIKDVEIWGNTIQNTDDLSDIKSVGTEQEDGKYKVEIVSCGKNLLDIERVVGGRLDDGNLGYESDSSINIIDNNSIKCITRAEWRGWCSNYISVKPDTEYSIKFNTIGGFGIAVIACFDANKNYIKKIDLNNSQNVDNRFTTLSNAKYIIVHVNYEHIGTYTVNLPILEEGTVATEYEPYECGKTEILLPCPLEGIGDFKDKLYYDGENWCIEKKIAKTTISKNIFTSIDIRSNGFARWLMQDNAEFLDCEFEPSSSEPNGFCNKYPVIPDDESHNPNRVGLATVGGTTTYRLMFVVPNNIDTHAKMDEYIKANPFEIYYPTINPTKIILPKSTQVALNSYADKTHIYFAGDVEGTVKGKVAKSLGASVNSNTDAIDDLRQEIDDIANMKGSEDFSYEGEGSIICQNTNEGVVKEFELEGKTLVNCWDINAVESAVRQGNYIKGVANGSARDVGPEYSNSYGMFEEDTDYTLIFHVKSNTINNDGTIYLCVNWINRCAFDITWAINGEQTGYFIKKVRSRKEFAPENLEYSKLPIRTQLMDDCTSGEFVYNCLALKGDYTQNPPEYFEGLQSVGQDVDKIEVLSKNNYEATIIPLRFNGRFNFSVDGVNNVKWVYSDGTESTSLSQDKTINEDSYCLLYVYDEDISNMKLYGNGTGASFIGDLSDFVGIENYLSLSNCTNITGSVDNLSNITNYLSLYNCRNITGSIDNLSNLTEYLSLGNCTNVTGSIDNLSNLTDTLNLYNCTNITGSVDNLSNITNYLNLYNCTNITGSIDNLSNITNYLNLDNCRNVTGSIDNLSNITNYLNLNNCRNVTGSIDNLSNITDNLYLNNCKNITGSIDNLSNITESLNLTGCTQVTGSIDSLSNITDNLYLNSCSNITGTLDNLSKVVSYLGLTDCTQVTGVFTPSSINKCPTLILRNTGQTVEDVDNTLIAIANMTNANINKTFDLNERSSASDAAVMKLKGFGCTIKCNGVEQ